MQGGSEEQAKAASAEKSSAMSMDSKEKSTRLLEAYEPLPYSQIEAEMLLFQEVQESMNHLWEEECQKYEETMEVIVDGEKLIVPRRNYLNEKGVVDDETLFPYHTACYPLLDAYDCLYEEDQAQQPISVDAIRPCDFVPPSEREYYLSADHEEVQGFMPSTVEAILNSLVHEDGGYGGDSEYQRRFFWSCMTNVVDLQNGIHVTDTLDALKLDTDPKAWADFVAGKLPSSSWYGPSNLPRERHERVTILLKLMRHSLSELQRDKKLAAAALTTMMRYHDLHDIDVFRRFLTVFDSETVVCDSIYPDEEFNDAGMRNFLCHDWGGCHLKFFSEGVAWFTHEHAVCLAGFVRATYLREFGSLVLDTTESSFEGKRKSMLKRAVCTLRAEADEDEEGRGIIDGRIPVIFIQRLVACLSCRAVIEIRRLMNLRRDPLGVPEDVIRKCVDTYHNCIRTLVSIAESTVQILPENERTYLIASALVLALCRALVPYKLVGDCDEEYNDDQEYVGLNKFGFLRDSRLISPFRYAKCITTSTKAKLEHLARHSKLQPNMDQRVVLIQEFASLFDREPPSDVRDVVSGLFLRNLVDIRQAGLGYGDFLLWCRYEISPLDPLLFWSEYAYPFEEEVDEESDNEDEVDPEDQAADWDIDEDERMLTVGEIRARHDFTLLLLLRAWQAPWSPESHASFQPDFREAVKMVAQCTHRLGFPHEVMLAVCSFLNRDWWEDSRKQCWSYECLCEQSSKAVAQKFSGQNAISAAPATLEYCPRCRVAMYCSKDCRDNDYKLGHKKSCCRPPMQSTVPVKEELQLCVEILNDGTTPLPTFLTSRNTAAADLVRQAHIVPGNDNGNPGSNLGDSDDDDEGSWETVDSGDEEMEEADVSRITTTARIYKYFKETSNDTKC